MLVRFSSTETESIVMFGDVAVTLIRMMGSSGAIPGAIGADDVPEAARRLRERVQSHVDPRPSEDPDTIGTEVPLATRAAPLFDLLQRAGAAKVPVMWEAG